MVSYSTIIASAVALSLSSSSRVTVPLASKEMAPITQDYILPLAATKGTTVSSNSARIMSE